ncbi:MAG: hypothetical protein FWH33_11115 [Oscillospiraceae bacterium]|nr:hypothetical protein [Oscillospiraceae bacterium]
MMKNDICYIVAAGENFGLDFAPRHNDYVIGVDGGLRYLEQSHIKPDMIVGDFDSLQYNPTYPNVITLSKEKDCTDTYAAVQNGLRLGYTNFHLYCCTGGRIDHTSQMCSCWHI